jgi:hypothetical protein
MLVYIPLLFNKRKNWFLDTAKKWLHVTPYSMLELTFTNKMGASFYNEIFNVVFVDIMRHYFK